MFIKNIYIVLLFTLSLIACGGGGDGENTGTDGGINGLSCDYNLPEVGYLNIDLEITEPHEKAPPKGTILSVWYNPSSGGTLQGKRSTGGIYTFDSNSWSYSVDSQNNTTELWMSNSTGDETYTLTVTSPTKGIWSSVSRLNSSTGEYISKGTFELPRAVACLSLDTSNSKVTAFDKSLSPEEESQIANGRTVSDWKVTPALSKQDAYIFTTDTDETVLGVYSNGVVSNEVVIPYGSYGFLSSPSPYQYGVVGQFFDDTQMLENPAGGWLYINRDGFFHSVDEESIYSRLNVGIARYTSQYGTPLTNGTFATFGGLGKFRIVDDEFNEVCASSQTYTNSNLGNGGYGQNVVNGYLVNNYFKSVVEDDNGYIYTVIIQRDAARISVTKWDSSCNLEWIKSQSIYTAGAYPSPTVFKIAGDHIYLAYQDKYINNYPSGDQSSRVRYTFSRFATSNGAEQIIKQYESRTDEFGYVFDVVEDANNDLILAHGDYIEKINGETFESIISYTLDGYKPLVPLNFNSDGNLEVNNLFVVDKSLL